MKMAIRSFNQIFVFLFAVVSLACSAPAYAGGGPAGFADLAEKLLPSVVNISTTQTISPKGGMEDFPDLQLPPGSPFEQFFKDFLDRQQGKGSPRKQKATALGSGFIIHPDGYIVTNNHVIDGADEIHVILQDNTDLSAKVVGRDKKTDLALLKVNAKKPLVAASFGDSDKVRVGDWILAIGNPYGLGGTVTAGIISARSRNIQSGPYDEYIQTDAPINRGNSGGPMFDMDGNVVGINTAIYSPSGGSIGIGFAIPSSLAKNIVEQLKSSGHIRRGWLGVRIQTVTQEIADGLVLGKKRGALVSGVTEDGPAAKSGIKAGDVIVEFDGREVPDMHKLPLMVAETDIGKSVDVVVFRKGRNVTVKVKVGELPQSESGEDEEGGDNIPDSVPNAVKIGEIGVSVAPINDAIRSRFALKKDLTGIVVTSIASEGLAAEQGVQVGDVIVEAGQKAVSSPKDLQAMIKEAKSGNKPLLMLINRNEDTQYIAIVFGGGD